MRSALPAVALAKVGRSVWNTAFIGRIGENETPFPRIMRVEQADKTRCKRVHSGSGKRCFQIVGSPVVKSFILERKSSGNAFGIKRE